MLFVSMQRKLLGIISGGFNLNDVINNLKQFKYLGATQTN
jgi:hypothetical protein